MLVSRQINSVNPGMPVMAFQFFFLYDPALQAALKDLRYQPRNVLLVCRMMRGLDAGE